MTRREPYGVSPARLKRAFSAMLFLGAEFLGLCPRLPCVTASPLKFLSPASSLLSLLLLLIPSPADFFRNVERTISTGDSTCFAAFLGVCFVRLATVSIRYSRLDCSRQSTGEGRDSDSRRAQPDRKRSWPN